MRNNRGFTLIELMIVVGIIAIIAAIAIPNMLRARLASNEASAVGSLRTLASGEQTFQSGTALDVDNDGIGEFGTLNLLSAAVPGYIDEAVGSGQKSGYLFTVTTTGVANTDEIQWEGTAFPISKNRTGNRTFYVDESGVIRASDLGGATGAPGTPATRLIALPVGGAGGFPPVGG